ncbi:hypothetical protein SEA_BLINO_68 [Gordonia phage Blino]|uniref:Uncharacterized protein n=2 Tax=Jujuvirus TaxID=2948772 RepID=A0A7T0M0W6_9CAUD|nr:hypothetical protein BIZ75_gp67 [Gordonia phage CarolAnn]YP_010103774.1 hypothetical protein KNU69_gp73 [Gordonia phage JuJu]YP_010114157.1 hypothetical protein KNV70_gp68 [Gordonia phage Blino]AOE44084.1 hypothetical protein SEA_CAROLANN_67 [Gordonia phage CarolAnn]QDP44189.1 hypothetical protein SEA_JUJU_73 [Gordonia phage JuJu]QPL14016.1 hypothetical protein SEA_BLINO_68 [Gordonia phage Blino]
MTATGVLTALALLAVLLGAGRVVWVWAQRRDNPGADT